MKYDYNMKLRLFILFVLCGLFFVETNKVEINRENLVNINKNQVIEVVSVSSQMSNIGASTEYFNDIPLTIIEKNIVVSNKELDETNIKEDKTPFQEETNVVEEMETLTEDVVESTTYSGFIINADNVDDYWLYSLEQHYMLVPENIRVHFQTNGGTVRCTTGSLSHMFFDGSVSIKACIRYNSREIWVEDRESAIGAIVHEMGHYLDYAYDFISEGDEFIAIRNEELNAFCSINNTHPNNYNTQKEYFAESFYLCITNPELMQANCPKTYDFVMNCSNNL